MDFKTPAALQEVWEYAEVIGAKRIEIRGHRAAVRLADGTVVEERADIGRSRAVAVARMFEGLVASVETLESSYSDDPELGDWRQRKVSIQVIP